MRRLAVVLLLVLVGAAPTQAVHATSGSDQEPRRNLQALIDETPDGGVLVLDAGTYQGGVTIDRPMTITGGLAAVIDAGGKGTAIEVAAADVTIDTVTIRHTGDSLDRENAGVSVTAPRVTVTNNVLEDVLFGVFLRAADDSVVANNVIGAKDVDIARRGDGIRLWESAGTRVEGNVVRGGRDVVLWFSNDLVVKDNVVEDGRYGLHFMYSDNARVEGNRLADNSTGAFLMYSRDLVLHDNVVSGNHGPAGYGLGLKDMDGVQAEGNHFVGNRVGLYLDNSPWSVDVWQTFDHNLFAYNDVGVAFLPSVQRNTFTENAFIDNGEQVAIQGGGVLRGNEWHLAGVGNYWSDFAGYDADGDGLGDVPYRLEHLYSTMSDHHPELRFFDETPAAGAIDLAGRLFPVLRPNPKVEDPAPLVRVPAFAPLGATADQAPGVVLPSALMLALASLVVVVAVPRRRQSVGGVAA